MQPLLTQVYKFWYLPLGHHIFYEYAQHNNLRYPMMGEVSLKAYFY